MRSAAGAAFVLVALACSCNAAFRFDERYLAPDGGEAADAGFSGDALPPKTRCTSDEVCPSPTPRCDLESGRCVACRADDDCARPAARCSPALHVCVECLVRDDCGPRQRCDGATSRCLDTCSEGDEDCPGDDLVCDEKAALCIECRSNLHCTGNPRGARCDPDVRRCVECVGSAHCPLERPTCDRRRGACVACVTSAECADGEACDPSRSDCFRLP